MRPRRVAVVVVACAVAVSGVIVALVITKGGHENTTLAYQSTELAPTTGSWAPITVARPKVPIIAGGIPVEIDPTATRNADFSTTLFHLGPRRYRMTIFNTSSLGAVKSLQWYPPVGVHVLKVLGSTHGRCTLTGLTGFGGNQFPTVVLNPNILCDRLDLKPPSCTCLGDGGDVAISFVTDKEIAVGEGDLRLRRASLVFDRVPLDQNPRPKARPLMRIATDCVRVPAGCASDAVDSGGLTAREQDAAQRAMDSLQNSNISLQLVTISRWVQSVPSMCRVRLVSRNPSTFKVYVFWIPWLAAQPYVWLNMHVTDDPRTSTFDLGTVQPVLPGGRLKPNGQTVNRRSVDTTLLSRYGPEQARKSREILAAHGGDVFAKPGAMCELLKNGSLRLRPNS
jgi:hypothetical protein